MTKFSKAARDVYKTYPTASEFELNEYLQRKMNISEVWVPPI